MPTECEFVELTHNRYLDALSHTVDGNFQQTQKIKPMDAKDYPLTLNAMYFSNERDFETFRKNWPRDNKEVRQIISMECDALFDKGHSRPHATSSARWGTPGTAGE